MEYSTVTKNPAETKKLGCKIAKSLKSGDVAALIGGLGAGKTCFTQGLLEGLGVAGRYKGRSPTFILMNEYKGKLPVYHFDVYRLNSIQEFIDLGYEEYFYGEGVTVIEWADKIEELLPEGCIRINIKILNEKEREIYINNGRLKTVKKC